MLSYLRNIDPNTNYKEKLTFEFGSRPPTLHGTWSDAILGKYTNTRHQTGVCASDLELINEKFNPLLLDYSGDTFFDACLYNILSTIHTFWSLELHDEANKFIEMIKSHWQKVDPTKYFKHVYNRLVVRFLATIPDNVEQNELCKRIEALLFPEFIDYSVKRYEKIALYIDMMMQYQIINYPKFVSSLIFPPWASQDTEYSSAAVSQFFETLRINCIALYHPIPKELQEIITDALSKENQQISTDIIMDLVKYYESDILKYFPKVLSHSSFISAWCSATRNALPSSIMQSSLLHENATMDYIMCCSDEASVRQFITLHQNYINKTLTNQDMRTPCMQFIIKFGTPPPEQLWHDPNLKDSDGKTVTDYWVTHIDSDGNNIPIALRAKYYTDATIGCEHAHDEDEIYMVDSKLYCKNCCDSEKATRVFNSLQECFICACEYDDSTTYAVFNECHHVVCNQCANRSIYCPFCRSGKH